MNDIIKNIVPIFPESPTDESNFVEWTSDEYGDMDCFLAIVKDDTSLENYNEIYKKYIDFLRLSDEIYGYEYDGYEPKSLYIELQVSFPAGTNELKEILLVASDNGYDNEIMGCQIYGSNDEIIGHTLLSKAEFEHLKSLSIKAVNELHRQRKKG